ncbi:hypothetical protein SAMN05421508_108202 [Caenispirillum bisanense]|uniref:DUF2892 domain-containing protein n=2 Tax=Caenispirillum bisanense TaxID=414052 RepID=A0A286GV97_9PROT|nr:hypothetical protein SAMN05421508_108202 [Caenispirillum bisanense]
MGQNTPDLPQETRAMIPDTAARIRDHSADSANARIDDETERRVLTAAHRLQELQGRMHDLESRLRDLDGEWDVERTLMANAATLTVIGSLLTAFVDRRFVVIPAVVSSFLLQHALQGWCPPLPLFRRRGVRSAREIEEERVALKALRGDFDGLPGTPATGGHDRGRAALAAARRA